MRNIPGETDKGGGTNASPSPLAAAPQTGAELSDTNGFRFLA